MKNDLIQLIQSAVLSLQHSGDLPQDISPQVSVQRPRDETHGDFATNIALMLSKQAGKNPRELAEKILAYLPENTLIDQAEIAGPGFINFKFKKGLQQSIIADILFQKADFGRSKMGLNKTINVEFVSANPTGPLHVGHGRGAAYGSALSSILGFAGFHVTREYYVNDAGRQMDILAVSVWLRYLEALGEPVVFPSNGYKGDYVYDIAKELKDSHARQLYCSIEEVGRGVFEDAPGGDKEKHIDGLIMNAKSCLGDGYERVHGAGLSSVLSDIQEDLHEFGVDHDHYFSEKSLMISRAVHTAVDALVKGGFTYEKEGALWFKSTLFEDDKDRVLIRENGITTYFASDAAYLLNKFQRGFDTVVYVLGADHHGYVPRLKALACAFGFDPDRLVIPLVQFAVLYRGGKQVQMSTRSGEFVTLRSLREEVGADAARYFYIMRKAQQHLDFDLDLAKSQSSDNPVYYIQYAHARIASIYTQLCDKGLSYNEQMGLDSLEGLTSSHETALITQLAKFPDVIEAAAAKYEPHMVCYYLGELAALFHRYYNVQRFIDDLEKDRNMRLTLLKAVKQVLENGLRLLTISAPDVM